MNPETRSGGETSLTAAALQALLSRLHPDPHQAGLEYERLRRKLVWFFELKGSQEPLTHADEALNRVARRLDQGQVVDNVAAYAQGVARLVLLEALRRQERARTVEATFSAITAGGGEEPNMRSACLDRCLGALPADSRRLILDYYREEGGRRHDTRKGLADQLGIASGVLRGRVFRIRERLEVCVNQCLGRASVEPAPPEQSAVTRVREPNEPLSTAGRLGFSSQEQTRGSR